MDGPSDRGHPTPESSLGPAPGDIEAKTQELLVAASAGDFGLASRDFGEVMQRALPPAKLADTWGAVERQLGAWRAVETIERKSEGGLSVALATSRFEHGGAIVKVVYDAGERIVGLFIIPIAPPWQPPAYARADLFEEREVPVGAAPALHGVLTLPKTSGTVPAVVLVHGSGPSDEDESIGALRPFKDLAWGLASRGIAVLRYVKRSRQAPGGIVTQKEEVLDAAHDALELLQRTPRVDPRLLFVLGHSQGGELAPRIARQAPGLAGIIVLAGPTQPLQDLLTDQYTYLLSLDPHNDSLAGKLEAARRFKQTVDNVRLRADEDVALPTGGTLKGAYFLDSRGYVAPAAAGTLACRILVLQGERDYQVPMRDFADWKRALAGKKGASLRSYPSLNHLFVAGVGPSRPQEYERQGHVDERVVRDIADWILQTSD
jgi:dienelactone hydrolase